MMKGKNLQSRLLYPTRISFRFDREIKTLTENKSSQNSAPQKQHYNKCKRNFSRQETQKKEKIYKNKPKTIKKMVIGTYLSTITLNVSRLNSPIKRHRLAAWIKKTKTLLYSAYKRLTSALRTHVGSK